jgi:hypothetical protein
MRRIFAAAIGAAGCLMSAAITAGAQTTRYFPCDATNSGQVWQRDWEWFRYDGTAGWHTFYFAPIGSYPFVPGTTDSTKQTGYYNYGDVLSTDTLAVFNSSHFGVTCYATPAGNGYYDRHQDYALVSGSLSVLSYTFGVDSDCHVSDDAEAEYSGPYVAESSGMRLDDCNEAPDGWDATDDSDDGGGGGAGGGGGPAEYCAWLVYFDEWGNITDSELIGCWYAQD